MFESGYYLNYEYQTCFDDGGVGHDMWWAKSRTRLDANNDEDAIAEAKKILEQSRPCDGTFCENKGRKRFGKLEHVETVIRQRKIAIGLRFPAEIR